MQLFKKFVGCGKPPFTTTLIEKSTQATGTVDIGEVTVHTGGPISPFKMCRLNLLIEGGIPGATYSHVLSITGAPAGTTTYSFVNQGNLTVIPGLLGTDFYLNLLGIALGENAITVRCTTTDNYGRVVVADLIVEFDIVEIEDELEGIYIIEVLDPTTATSGELNIRNIPEVVTSLEVRFTFTVLIASVSPLTVNIMIPGMTAVNFTTSGIPSFIQTRVISTPGPVNAITGLKDSLGNYSVTGDAASSVRIKAEVISPPVPTSPYNISQKDIVI